MVCPSSVETFNGYSNIPTLVNNASPCLPHKIPVRITNRHERSYTSYANFGTQINSVNHKVLKKVPYCKSYTTANPVNDYLTSIITPNSETDHFSKKIAHYVPKIMVTNIRSLVPKIEEIQEFINRNQISIVFVTETWLRSTIMDSVVDITGYSLIRKDRSSDCHGGVATLY